VKRLGWQGAASVAVTLAVVAVSATGAVAAGGGHGEEHATSPFDLIFPIINFLLFVFLLKYAGGESIRSYLQERRAQVIAALDTAGAAKSEAEQLHAEVRGRLARVAEEAETVRRDLVASAELERERRIKAAGDAVGRMKSDAQLVADQEVRAASAALRDETVKAAVAETVALLRRQIKDADQERFVGDFVREVQAGR
jgi:F0F1-type ATP synthase membrane subunit b/b'